MNATATQTYTAATVGNGAAIHTLRSAQAVGARLTTANIRCGAGRSRRAGVVGGPAAIRLTSEEVTCKRCIKITESDAIWAGNATTSTLVPVTPIEVTAPSADQLAAAREAGMQSSAMQAQRIAAMRMLNGMLNGEPDKTPAEAAYAVRIALRVLNEQHADGSIGHLALAELNRRYPAHYVAATRNETVFHLVNADGFRVEAGEYVAADGRRFALPGRPNVTLPAKAMVPVSVFIHWCESTPGANPSPWVLTANLVPGWHWVRANA